MRYIKTFEDSFSFYDEFHHKKIRDVNYYIDKIRKKNIGPYYTTELFHWACAFNFPELAMALVEFIPRNELINLDRSITYLDYEYFKKIIEKNNLYKELINRRDFLEYVIVYGKDKVKKFQLLEKFGVEINLRLLRLACYHGKDVELVKYFVSKGLDPNKKEKATYANYYENCLDLATTSNINVDLIRYLVNDLNMKVSFKNMLGAIDKETESLDILINSKNINYSWQKDVSINQIIRRLLNKQLNEYVEKLLKNYPDLIQQIELELRKTYQIQKILLDIDPLNIEYIRNYLHPDIAKEYDWAINASKYNL